MKLPFVSRERYDELAERHAQLEKRYDAMLVEMAKGIAPTRAAAKEFTARAQRDPMIDKMAADIGSTITDPIAARAEAERIKREAFGV